MSIFADTTARLQGTYDRLFGEQILLTPMVARPFIAIDPGRPQRQLVGIVRTSGGTDMAGSGRGPQANRPDLAMGAMSVSVQCSLFPTVADQPADNDQLQLIERQGQPVYLITGPGIPSGRNRLVWRLVAQP